MATSASSAILAPARAIGAAADTTGNKTQKRGNIKNVVYIKGVNSYGGLKAQNAVVAMGMPVSTEQCFANFTCGLNATRGSRSSGGALSSTCNAAAEIFKIAAIMNGLVLVGVAVGFVLLRIEASVEESE